MNYEFNPNEGSLMNWEFKRTAFIWKWKTLISLLMNLMCKYSF